MKRLEKNEERRIVQDWLQKEIQTPSHPQEIDQITQQTDQWPSHIQSYCNALKTYLKGIIYLRNHQSISHKRSLFNSKKSNQ
ncbi:MAG: hypothetical protein OXE77_11635 [Flavobacteriaceae bacterium]|nr:hypothetical protein [Flavobacteriaceae bacterium]MCY4267225.1 hypothetical protein [Flavobacteriaceae bacterium]